MTPTVVGDLSCESRWLDRSTVLWGGLIFILAAATRVTLLALPPIYDELYHILPALSWLNDGTLSVADGAYERAPLYTVLVAQMLGSFGEENIAAARVPSVVAGAALVALVSVWTRMRIGRVAGWYVAAALTFWALGIMVSQFVRFYAIHGFLCTLGAIAVYEAVASAKAYKKCLAWCAVAVISFAGALSLQPATLVAIAATLVWLGVAVVLPMIWRLPMRWWIMGGFCLLALAAFLAALQSGLLGKLLAFYRWQPWPAADDAFTYHRMLRDNYPTFWTLFPIAAIVALAKFPRIGLFCVVFFTFSFLAFSFGGIKNGRYLYVAMPFFFVLWAAGLQSIGQQIYSFLKARAEQASTQLGIIQLGPLVAMVTIWVSLAFVVTANANFERAASIVFGSGGNQKLQGRRRLDWRTARATAQPWLTKDAVIVTTEETFALRYLGGFDYGISKPRLSEIPGTRLGELAPEFSIDPRNGRPLISSFDSFRKILNCHPTGIFIAASGWWSRNGILGSKIIAAVETNNSRPSLIRKRDYTVFSWDATGKTREPDCSGMGKRL